LLSVSSFFAPDCTVSIHAVVHVVPVFLAYYPLFGGPNHTLHRTPSHALGFS
jgi:hypothetical protein